MANPVLESSANAEIQTSPSSSITVTAPTGITTGDLLLIFVSGLKSGADFNINTPTGFTLMVGGGNASRYIVGSYYKVAVLADETAPNYTVSFGGAGIDDALISMHRVSGVASGSEISGSEVDVDNAATGTTPSFTTALTPQTAESLLFVVFAGRDLSITAEVTTSGYTLTPATTLTESVDIATRDGLSDGISMAVAYGDYDGTTEITNRAATFSQENNDVVSFIIVVNAPQDASGTVALHSVSPTFHAPTAEVGATGTNALLSISPTIPTQSGEGVQPTVWTTTNKS